MHQTEGGTLPNLRLTPGQTSPPTPRLPPPRPSFFFTYHQREKLGKHFPQSIGILPSKPYSKGGFCQMLKYAKNIEDSQPQFHPSLPPFLKAFTLSLSLPCSHFMGVTQHAIIYKSVSTWKFTQELS